MESAVSGRLLWSWDTEYPADTAEFCPLPPYRHLLLCGTYKLRDGQPPDQAPEACRRDGRLHLLDAAAGRELQRLDTAALLDTRWCPVRQAGRLLAAAADSLGQL
ncbi:diphthine methyltransferase-like, partial [Pollicipes pollicipes]|uniref:diphthine methyltransferase-like n=1 Tax=Pollicipes pollicipes TaxID=41117 RepID=UPI001884C804